MHEVKLFVGIIAILLYCSSVSYSQIDNTFNNNSSEGLTRQDTTSSDSLPKVNTFKTIFSGLPGRAALYSLVLPSGGQIYNRKWWKVPLALGIDGYLFYNVDNCKKLYKKFDVIIDNYNRGISDPDYSLGQAINNRKQVRTALENAWVYFVLGHLATVFDAYVDRHLMEFDISPNLSIKPFQGNPENNQISLVSITYKFK